MTSASRGEERKLLDGARASWSGDALQGERARAATLVVPELRQTVDSLCERWLQQLDWLCASLDTEDDFSPDNSPTTVLADYEALLHTRAYIEKALKVIRKADLALVANWLREDVDNAFKRMTEEDTAGLLVQAEVLDSTTWKREWWFSRMPLRGLIRNFIDGRRA